MIRKRSIASLIGLSFVFLVVACTPPEEIPFRQTQDAARATELQITSYAQQTTRAQLATEEAQQTPEPTDEPTATVTPTATDTATATATATTTNTIAPPDQLALVDGTADGVDCAFGTPLESTPPEIDLQELFIEAGLDDVQFSVSYPEGLDLAAVVSALNLPYSIQVGIADSAFPLPPVEAGRWSVDFQNQVILFVWFNTPDPIQTLTSIFRDGAWAAQPDPVTPEIEFTEINRLRITIPNAGLPQSGRLYVNTVIDNRFCDVVGADETGPTVLFTFEEEHWIFTEEN